MDEKAVVKCEECGAYLKVLQVSSDHYKEGEMAVNGVESRYTPINKKSLEAVERYKIPFVCSLCGSISMPFRPIRAVVFLWIPPVPEKIGAIIIPDYEGRQGNARDLMRDPIGVILACGPGAYTPEGGFIPSENVEVGDLVLYTKEVPWSQQMVDPTGKEHRIILCSYADIIGVAKAKKL